MKDFKSLTRRGKAGRYRRALIKALSLRKKPLRISGNPVSR